VNLLAILRNPPQCKVNVRMFGIEVGNRNLFELHAQVLLHPVHQVASDAHRWCLGTAAALPPGDRRASFSARLERAKWTIVRNAAAHASRSSF
jgi:hypothetical protein